MKKFILVIIFIFSSIVLFSFVYWYKCNRSIDILPAYSLSRFLPVALQKKVKPELIFNDETGILFQDSFENQELARNWEWVPKKEAEIASASFDINTLNNSRCLLIANGNGKSWSLQYRRLVIVSEGDDIEFSGYMRAENIQPGGLGMILFDENFRVVSVSYAQQDQELKNSWKHLFGKFKVPHGVYCLRFMSFGSGNGKVSFDDVKFARFR